MIIGGVDAQTTGKLMKRQERKRKLQRAKQLDNEPEITEISDETSFSSDETSSDIV